jgi:acetylornithine deacetylase/succinyl-diaminopimelate desuccinylase-like protein
MIDWQAAGEEATQLLRRYVQIDTTNPPGNERPAAEFLAEVLRQRRLEPQLYESAPGRANLVARLQGEGERGPVLLLHHMDVVPADARPGRATRSAATWATATCTGGGRST